LRNLEEKGEKRLSQCSEIIQYYYVLSCCSVFVAGFDFPCVFPNWHKKSHCFTLIYTSFAWGCSENLPPVTYQRYTTLKPLSQILPVSSPHSQLFLWYLDTFLLQ